MKKKSAFTLVEILISMLIFAIISIAVYRTIVHNTKQSADIIENTRLEIEVTKALDRIASYISTGGFNPASKPFSIDKMSEKINFFCLGERKLFFASDLIDSSGTRGEYDGLINSLDTACPTPDIPCNCIMSKADPREVTMLEFRKNSGANDCISGFCTYRLIKNAGADHPDGTVILNNIVRGKFEYFERDPSTQKPTVPFVLDSNQCNICDLAMVKVIITVRGNSPIKGYKNSTFIPETPREKALVFTTSGDYFTFSAEREVILKNRGTVKVGDTVTHLCVPPDPTLCP